MVLKSGSRLCFSFPGSQELPPLPRLGGSVQTEVSDEHSAHGHTAHHLCLLVPLILRFPWWLSSKESTCNAGAAGDVGSIPGSGRSLGGGNGSPLQYSCWENPIGSQRVGHNWAGTHTSLYQNKTTNLRNDGVYMLLSWTIECHILFAELTWDMNSSWWRVGKWITL